MELYICRLPVPRTNVDSVAGEPQEFWEHIIASTDWKCLSPNAYTTELHSMDYTQPSDSSLLMQIILHWVHGCRSTTEVTQPEQKWQLLQLLRQMIDDFKVSSGAPEHSWEPGVQHILICLVIVVFKDLDAPLILASQVNNIYQVSFSSLPLYSTSHPCRCA